MCAPPVHYGLPLAPPFLSTEKEGGGREKRILIVTGLTKKTKTHVNMHKPLNRTLIYTCNSLLYMQVMYTPYRFIYILCVAQWWKVTSIFTQGKYCTFYFYFSYYLLFRFSLNLV